jgi:hypothetical protein
MAPVRPQRGETQGFMILESVALKHGLSAGALRDLLCEIMEAAGFPLRGRPGDGADVIQKFGKGRPLRVHEVCAVMRVSAMTVHRLISNGDLTASNFTPAGRAKGNVRVWEKDLLAYLGSTTITPGELDGVSASED